MTRFLSYGGWVLGPDCESLRGFFDALLPKSEHHAAMLALLEHRLSKAPQELGVFADIALTLVGEGPVLVAEGATVPDGNMTTYYWEQVAHRLLPLHARDVVRRIFAAQDDPRARHWFLSHRQSMAILSACLAADPNGTWEELAPFLENEKDAFGWTLTFGQGALLFDSFPRTRILDWIGQDPYKRASIVARLCARTYADDTLAASILERFGDVRGVEGAFAAAYSSGSWVGPASVHWDDLAENLEKARTKSTLPAVRKWTATTAAQLRRQAAADRKSEAEEKIRRR